MADELRIKKTTAFVLLIITALLYLNIYQHKKIDEYQHINTSQQQIIQQYDNTLSETPTPEAPEDSDEPLSAYEQQQQSGEYAPYERGKLYIPIDTPDNI